jgi:hypothetical protein
VKVMFVFALLDRQQMAVDEVARYLARVACYRNLSERFLGKPPEALAEWLIEDLRRAGAIDIAGNVMRPTGTA